LIVGEGKFDPIYIEKGGEKGVLKKEEEKN